MIQKKDFKYTTHRIYEVKVNFQSSPNVNLVNVEVVKTRYQHTIKIVWHEIFSRELSSNI